MIDSHCHIETIEKPEDILTEARTRGMKAIITSSQDPEEARRAFDLQEKCQHFLFVCLGWHPTRLRDAPEQLGAYTDFIRANQHRAVGIGEVGLDYYWMKGEKQRHAAQQIFVRFVTLAKELDLPLVIHCREAYDDVFALLEQHGAARVMMHCFSGSKERLALALERGYMISLATNVCYTKKHQLLAEKTPLSQMLLETDSPWLNPFDPKKPENRPWHIAESARVIGELHNLPPSEVLARTAANARRFFGLRI
ncbi:MAG: TatD family hydrolase [Candidatus Aenigmarchaeota archaeon]|nr:TatD family hydrolase [Candidatus Aenigmarchaeota archaeon]